MPLDKSLATCDVSTENKKMQDDGNEEDELISHSRPAITFHEKWTVGFLIYYVSKASSRGKLYVHKLCVCHVDSDLTARPIERSLSIRQYRSSEKWNSRITGGDELISMHRKDDIKDDEKNVLHHGGRVMSSENFWQVSGRVSSDI